MTVNLKYLVIIFLYNIPDNYLNCFLILFIIVRNNNEKIKVYLIFLFQENRDYSVKKKLTIRKMKFVN